jgi:hypothetical protein
MPSDLFSHMFMRWGSAKELNALVTFMASCAPDLARATPDNPCYDFTDRGLVYLTPDVMARAHQAGVRNMLTGQPFSLAFLLAASPDGIIVDRATGERFNCEWKAATAFKPARDKYAGLTFLFDYATKPYPKIKSYYIPQMMLQMLVCETRKCKFACWTYGPNGMNVWEVYFNVEYVSLMLTILDHLYETFIAHNRDVPVGYFAAAPMNVREMYERFIVLTLAIVDMEDGLARFVKTIPGDFCMQVTDDILNPPGKTGHQLIRNDIYFPNVSPYIPAYPVISVIAEFMLAATASSGARWIDAPRDTRGRAENLKTCSGMTILNNNLSFTRPVIKRIVEKGIAQHSLLNRDASVIMWRLDKAETYLLFSLMILYRIYVRMREASTGAGAQNGGGFAQEQRIDFATDQLEALLGRYISMLGELTVMVAEKQKRVCRTDREAYVDELHKIGARAAEYSDVKYREVLKMLNFVLEGVDRNDRRSGLNPITMHLTALTQPHRLSLISAIHHIILTRAEGITLVGDHIDGQRDYVPRARRGIMQLVAGEIAVSYSTKKKVEVTKVVDEDNMILE